MARVRPPPPEPTLDLEVHRFDGMPLPDTSSCGLLCITSMQDACLRVYDLKRLPPCREDVSGLLTPPGPQKQQPKAGISSRPATKPWSANQDDALVRPKAELWSPDSSSSRATARDVCLVRSSECEGLGPDSQVVAVCVKENVVLYDVAQHAVLGILKLPAVPGSGSIESAHLTFLPSSGILACGVWDRTVRLWNLREFMQTARAGSAVPFSKFSVGRDTLLRDSVPALPSMLPTASLTGHSGIVNSIQSEDARWPNRVISGSNKATAMIWDVVKCEKVGYLCIARKPVDRYDQIRVDSIEILGGGHGVSSGASIVLSGPHISFFDTRSLKEVQSRIHPPENERICSTAWSESREILVAGSGAGTTMAYDLRKMDKTLWLHKRAHSNCVVYSCIPIDDSLLATGSNDRKVKVWKWDGKLMNTVAISEWCFGLAWIPPDGDEDRNEVERRIGFFLQMLVDAGSCFRLRLQQGHSFTLPGGFCDSSWTG